GQAHPEHLCVECYCSFQIRTNQCQMVDAVGLHRLSCSLAHRQIRLSQRFPSLLVKAQVSHQAILNDSSNNPTEERNTSLRSAPGHISIQGDHIQTRNALHVHPKNSPAPGRSSADARGHSLPIATQSPTTVRVLVTAPSLSSSTLH